MPKNVKIEEPTPPRAGTNGYDVRGGLSGFDVGGGVKVSGGSVKGGVSGGEVFDDGGVESRQESNSSMPGDLHKMDSMMFLNKIEQARRVSMAPTASSEVEAAMLAKLKPWDKRKMHKTELRVKLSNPATYRKEETKIFTPKISTRILVRLERVMGNTNVMLSNPRYLRKLGTRITEDEEMDWKKRKQSRHALEHERIRELVIYGHAEPLPGMEALKKHPVFRVNRVMRKLEKMDINDFASISLPDIKPHEPFDELKSRGRLFGWHKDHYLTVGDLESRYAKHKEKSLSVYSPYYTQPSTTPTSPPLHLADESIMVEESETDEVEMSDEEFEFEIEDPDIDLAVLLGHPSLLRLALGVMGIGIENLEKNFTIRTSTLVEKLFSDDPVTAHSLFTYAREMVLAYKRQQRRGTEFCNKLHKNLLAI